jgi:hypothetical protein
MSKQRCAFLLPAVIACRHSGQLFCARLSISLIHTLQ